MLNWPKMIFLYSFLFRKFGTSKFKGKFWAYTKDLLIGSAFDIALCLTRNPRLGRAFKREAIKTFCTSTQSSFFLDLVTYPHTDTHTAERKRLIAYILTEGYSKLSSSCYFPSSGIHHMLPLYREILWRIYLFSRVCCGWYERGSRYKVTSRILILFTQQNRWERGKLPSHHRSDIFTLKLYRCSR